MNIGALTYFLHQMYSTFIKERQKKKVKVISKVTSVICARYEADQQLVSNFATKFANFSDNGYVLTSKNRLPTRDVKR